MNLLFEWLERPVVQRLGWTLLHFMWQGAVLALIYAGIRAALPRRGANARYLAGCLVLGLMAVAPLLTFRELPTTPQTTAPPGSPASLVTPVSPLVPSGLAASGEVPRSSGPLSLVSQVTQASVPWLAVFWLAGVLVLSLRLTAGWVSVRRWTRQAADTLDRSLQARLHELQARLGIKRTVSLLRSAVVRVPTVVGWLRPAILLPASTITGLTPPQLDFVIAHELAHVRRGDAWMNLLQTLIETLLFYHPAVWWVSRRVREDREHCCDDLALAVCGDRLAGAQALATLEEIRQWSGGLALAANEGSLLTRVRRLLGIAEGRQDWRRTAGSSLLVVGVLLLVVGSASLFMGKPLFASTCRLIPQRLPGDAHGVQAASSPGSADPAWLRTEMELVGSTEVLRAVVKRLDLVRTWNLGTGPFSEALALEQVRGSLALSVPSGTHLVQIRVERTNPEEAAQIANALAEAYREQRDTQRQQASSQGLVVLQENLSRWTDTVSRRQQQVDRLREVLGVMDVPGEGPDVSASLERELASSMAQQLTYAKAEYTLSSTKLEELRKLTTNELRRAILTALPGEEILPQLLRDQTALQQELVKLRQEYAEQHPAVQRAAIMMATTEEQIHDRLSGMMTGLENHLRSLKQRSDELQQGLDEGKTRLMAEAAKWRQFYEEKRSLEGEQRARDALYLRVMQEQIDADVLSRGRAEIVDRAELALRPSGLQISWPTRTWGFGLACCVGGLALRLTGRRSGSDEPLGSGARTPG